MSAVPEFESGRVARWTPDRLRLKWWLWRVGSRARTALGPGGVMAAGALIAGVLVWAGLWMHLTPSSRATRPADATATVSAPATEATRPASSEGPRTQTRDPLHQRWRQWPLESSHSRDLDRLMALAQAHGVTLDSGRVRRLAQADEPWVQIEMEVRMNQPWSQVRAFLAGALNRMPNLALQSVRLAREDASASRVEAQLVLRWVYRLPSSGGRP